MISKKESDHRYYVKNVSRRLKWKGKYIHINKARKGVCDFCGAIKGKDVKQTQFHHLEYDDKNPEKHIVELCAACHRKESMKQQGQEKIKAIARLGGLAHSREHMSEMGKSGNKNRKWVYNTRTKKLQIRRGWIGN